VRYYENMIVFALILLIKRSLSSWISLLVSLVLNTFSQLAFSTVTWSFPLMLPSGEPA
ncbi:22478_t:CDS:1, partial [Gigaspora rosea]